MTLRRRDGLQFVGNWMSASDNITVLANGRSAKDYWTDFFMHRELLYFLAWRDILVRYKQTLIGAGWVLIRPLLTMLVFTVVFGKIAGLSSGPIPYSLVVFAGMLPWYFFSSSLTDCSNSLVTNAQLLSKVYFPRLIVPFSTMLVSLVDFTISGVLLVGLMLWFGHWPDWHMLFLPFFVVLAATFSMGLGLWAAALNVRYRDFRHLIPFFLQLGIYVSPVGYSAELIPEKWRLLYSLNPMVGIIAGFRWSILGGDTQLYWPSVVIAAFAGVLLTFTGIRYFRKAEASFADVI
ncbi:ABC transporter permease [Cupriavidus sp. KB_39]|jgi:lipopolysaccharide transport system permease protein|uniref:ABC transporter permease n=1 Tax=Cupriavidus sp. KB_39 TaxID=3233036 RepID=UPI003F90FE71